MSPSELAECTIDAWLASVARRPEDLTDEDRVIWELDEMRRVISAAIEFAVQQDRMRILEIARAYGVSSVVDAAIRGPTGES